MRSARDVHSRGTCSQLGVGRWTGRSGSGREPPCPRVTSRPTRNGGNQQLPERGSLDVGHGDCTCPLYRADTLDKFKDVTARHQAWTARAVSVGLTPANKDRRFKVDVPPKNLPAPIWRDELGDGDKSVRRIDTVSDFLLNEMGKVSISFHRDYIAFFIEKSCDFADV